MQNEHYAFFAEWKDPVSEDIRKFKLFYFSVDDTIELWDVRNQRLFLKRIKGKGITLKDIYIGAIIKVFSRTMMIIGYADNMTKTFMDVFSQKTLGILKPNSIDKKSNILKIVTDHNFRIVNLRLAYIDDTVASILYEEFRDEECFAQLITSIIDGAALIFELIGENAASRWSELVGPVDPFDAKNQAPESIRAQFGIDKINNAIYSPSVMQTVSKDLDLFFPKMKQRTSELNLSIKLNNSTCCVIKPHVIKEGKMADIISMIEQELGFEITGMRMCYLNIDEAEEFYEIYKTIFPYYQDLTEELSSGPCLAMEICASNGIDTAVEFRKYVGPHDPELARKLRPNTLRARFGKTKVENAVHVTDLPEDTTLELQYLFQRI